MINLYKKILVYYYKWRWLRKVERVRSYELLGDTKRSYGIAAEANSILTKCDKLGIDRQQFVDAAMRKFCKQK